MHEQPASKVGEVHTPMLIECPACRKGVTAPPEMVGQNVECPFCQQHFVVPGTVPDPAAIQAELAALEGQRRENASQVTELRGHVSRLNMELHRHELRMKNLTERQTQLDQSIASTRKKLGLE